MMFLLSIKGNEDMEIGLNENLVILLVSKSTNLRKKKWFFLVLSNIVGTSSTSIEKKFGFKL